MYNVMVSMMMCDCQSFVVCDVSKSEMGEILCFYLNGFRFCPHGFKNLMILLLLLLLLLQEIGAAWNGNHHKILIIRIQYRYHTYHCMCDVYNKQCRYDTTKRRAIIERFLTTRSYERRRRRRRRRRRSGRGFRIGFPHRRRI